jgi:hypothetical protein
MTTSYTIYLVNQSSKAQLFWAFLARPAVTNNPSVFANSNTNLRVAGLSSDLNSFEIPVQYVIGAGASNNAIGLNTVITSTATRNTDLQVQWDVSYATTPPLQGPTVPQSPSGESPASTVGMKTNTYRRDINETNGWYENMSFGVKTAQGFMGVTWNPEPSKTYIITPKLTFYITVGDYSSYSLADINSVSNGSAVLDTSKDFDLNNMCYVVYKNDGTWSHFKGRPPASQLSAARAQMLEFLPSGADFVGTSGPALFGNDAAIIAVDPAMIAVGPCTKVKVVDPLNGTLLTDGTGNMGLPGQGFAAKWFQADDLPRVNQRYNVSGEDSAGQFFAFTENCTRVHPGAAGFIGFFAN